MRKKNLSLYAATTVLAVCTALLMGFAIKYMPKAIIMRASVFLCAPTQAFAAERKVFIENEPFVSAAQTIDENDYSSGFWTELPSEKEILPSASEPLPQSEVQIQMPEGYMPILSAQYENGVTDRYIKCGTATIKNCTALSKEEISAEVLQELPFNIELNSENPQVLIMHTHATETYQLTAEPWVNPAFTARTTDNAHNMTAIGAQMTRLLNEAGINTVHDETLHDYPSYTGSYERSNKTVRSYLEQYPSIKVVLDVHRDAIQKDDGTRVKPVCEVNGESTAQVMLICGANKKGNLPNFKQNLRFASTWQSKMEELYPGFTRPLLFDYRYYNQDLTTGSILIEVGGHANTLDEAMNAGSFAANALIDMLKIG